MTSGRTIVVVPRTTAFPLLEFLAVIAILGLLVALLLPESFPIRRSCVSGRHVERLGG